MVVRDAYLNGNFISSPILILVLPKRATRDQTSGVPCVRNAESANKMNRWVNEPHQRDETRDDLRLQRSG